MTVLHLEKSIPGQMLIESNNTGSCFYLQGAVVFKTLNDETCSLFPQ